MINIISHIVVFLLISVMLLLVNFILRFWLLKSYEIKKIRAQKKLEKVNEIDKSSTDAENHRNKIEYCDFKIKRIKEIFDSFEVTIIILAIIVVCIKIMN